MNHPVIARAAEQGGNAFVLAGACKHLRAGHGKLDLGWGDVGSVEDFLRNADRVGGSGGGGRRVSGRRTRGPATGLRGFFAAQNRGGRGGGGSGPRRLANEMAA